MLAAPARALATLARPLAARTLRLPLDAAPAAAAPAPAAAGLWLRIGAACTGGPARGAAVDGFFAARVPQVPAAARARPLQPSSLDLYGETFSCAAF